MTRPHPTEQSVLRFSIAMTFVLALVGIGFGLASGASSIIFDGIYSLIDASMSTVALIDPQDDRPCKTRWVFLEGGAKERQSKRTGVIVPRNEAVLKQRDKPVVREAGPLDTNSTEATRQSYAPDEIVPKLNFNLKKTHD